MWDERERIGSDNMYGIIYSDYMYEIECMVIICLR